MKLQLEKEVRLSDPGPWYKITADGKFVSGSFDLKVIEKLYQRIKVDPSLLKNDPLILRSDEISLTL